MSVVEIVSSCVIAIATTLGAVIAYISYWRVRGETIRQCFEFLCDKNFTSARNFVQKVKIDPDKLTEEEREKVLLVVTTFELWGILVKKKYLPLSLFIDSDIGIKVCGCYEHLQDYIKYRREKSTVRNQHYADDFQQLYLKIRPNNK